MKLEKIVSDWLNRYPLIKRSFDIAIAAFSLISVHCAKAILSIQSFHNTLVIVTVFGYYDSYPVRNGYCTA